MRVMVFVKATADSEAGIKDDAETAQMFEDMGRFNDELSKAGVIKMGEGLHASSKGKRIAFDGDKRTVIDGPFPNPGELVAGFWMWEVKDMDEAIAWARKCPNPMPGPSELEIRPIHEMEDLPQSLQDAEKRHA